MGAFYDETRPCFHWSYHSPYLQVLLYLLSCLLLVSPSKVFRFLWSLERRLTRQPFRKCSPFSYQHARRCFFSHQIA